MSGKSIKVGEFNFPCVPGNFSFTNSLDNTLLVTSSYPTPGLWDFDTGKILKELTLPPKIFSSVKVIFSPNSKRIAMSVMYDSYINKNPKGYILLWNVKSAKNPKIIKGTHNINYFVFSSDSKWLATTNEDEAEYIIRIWDIDSGKIIKIFPKEGLKAIEAEKEAKKKFLKKNPEGFWFGGGSHSEAQIDGNFCTFSTDNKWIAATCNNNISLWDVQSEKCIKVLEGHKDKVSFCAFSPDNNWLASASNDRTMRIWSLEKIASIEEEIVLEGHMNAVTSCNFSPDGKWLASTSKDKTVRVWELFNQDGGLDPRLKWTSLSLLSAAKAYLGGVQGISDFNLELLKQHGARTLSKEEEKEKNKD